MVPVGCRSGGQFGQTLLGLMYLRGLGIDANMTVAADLFRKAAEQGDLNAQFNLSHFYSASVAVAKDPIVAFKWLIIASRTGEAEAIGARDDFKLRLVPDQIAEAETLARAWLARHDRK